jgi:hypothetical protein
MSVVEKIVGVVACTTGTAVVLETCAIDVVMGTMIAEVVATTLDDATAAPPFVLAPFTDGVVVVLVVVVVGGWAAACVARVPVSVVEARGTAVHR